MRRYSRLARKIVAENGQEGRLEVDAPFAVLGQAYPLLTSAVLQHYISDTQVLILVRLKARRSFQ